MKLILKLFLFSIAVLLLNSCATILKGYEDRVYLKNAPKGLKVYDQDGVEIPVMAELVNEPIKSQAGDLIVQSDRFIDTYFIFLRSDRSHTLLLKSGENERLVKVYPKVGFWWGVLDFFCGGLPIFFDAYTGAWNHFDDIQAGF
ncbi:MAG: hypothetical protein HRF52_11105 [Ignavibacterium sp.]|uniref:hypothetical protein n=1 Tax=Ignavibacterium sp. TaxID=2651167 RepID=UPI0032991433